jgi:hypothetical protein
MPRIKKVTRNDSPNMEMSKPEICDAIRSRQRMEFEYNGKLRIVEPQCYGIKETDIEGLRCHMIEGGSRDEQLFDVDKMKNLKLLTEYFTKPGPNYKKNDSAFKIIFCQL